MKKVRIGVSPFQDTLVPIIGQQKGWYKEEGLDVEIKILGWTEVQEALSSVSANRIDVGINNISSVIATHHRNPELVYYYGTNTFDDGFALMIRPNGRLKTLDSFVASNMPREQAVMATAQQLKGITVITTSNTDMEQGVAALARKGGLNFKSDVKIINLNPDEGLAAFLTGQGDAFIGGIPQRTRAEKEGMISMITGSDIGPAPINGFVTTRAFINSDSESLLKVLKVWFRTIKFIDQDLDAGGDIIVKQLNANSAAHFTIDDFKRFWNRVEHYPSSPAEVEKDILSPTGRNYWKAQWDDCNFYFKDVLGLIPAPVSADEAFYMLKAHEAYVRKYGRD
jgi:ABC-type nitrate/sulfonate/bicarbonate transport system substrate-binding protein